MIVADADQRAALTGAGWVCDRPGWCRCTGRMSCSLEAMVDGSWHWSVWDHADVGLGSGLQIAEGDNRSIVDAAQCAQLAAESWIKGER